MKILRLSFQKKSIDEINDSHSTKALSKELSLFQLICFGIGVIVGAGVFVLTGLAANTHSGPAVTLSFALSALIALFAALCYAEFASVIKTSGGVYSYTYLVFGELIAWVIAWIVIFSLVIAASFVASGWSSYFIDLVGFNLVFKSSPFVINFPAIGIIFCVSVALYRGVRFSAIITTSIVALKLLVLILFCVSGLFYIDIANFSPYIPQNTGVFGEFGFSGIVSGASMLFLSYNGFDSICTTAQEAKNPSRNIPLGILISIIISSIVYIGTATVLTGLVNYKELGISNVLSFAINKTDLPFMQYIVKIGALSALASVVMINQYSVSRMILTISKDGLLPISLSKIHKKYKAPTRIIIMIACAMIILTAFDDIANLARITGCLALVAISTVCFALIIFRFQYPCLKKGFVCPWVPVVPFLAIFSSIYVISSYEYKIYVQFTYIIIFISILYLALKYRQNHE